MWIKVDAHEYHIFFEALARAFRKEYGEACPHEWDDRKLWKLGVKVDGQSKMQYRSKQLFEAPNAHSHEYFWVRNNAAKKAIKKKGNEAKVQVNAAALILAFRYLEVKFDSSSNKYLADKTLSQKLWELFFTSPPNFNSNSISIVPFKSGNVLPERTFYDAYENYRSLDNKSEVSEQDRKLIYKRIFDFTVPLDQRINCLSAIIHYIGIEHDEILALIEFPVERIFTITCHNLPWIIEQSYDCDPMKLLKAATKAAATFQTNKYIIEAVVYGFMMYDCNAIAYVHKYFFRARNQFNPDLAEELLDQLMEFFLNKKHLTFLGFNFLSKDVPPNKILEEIIKECYEISSNDWLVNRFKFILIRRHPDIYRLLRDFFPSLLKDKELNYNDYRS